MYELVKFGEKTFVIKGDVNVGIYVCDNNDVCLIDTGNSPAFVKCIIKVLKEKNWNLKYIINTHSHADHMAGNTFLQDTFKCKAYANEKEMLYINYPDMQAGILYGASPLDELCNPFVMGQKCICEDIRKMSILGLEVIELFGHTSGMIGIKTSDDVFFCADAYTSKEILDKYSLQYMYDVDRFLDSLNQIENISAKYFVPYHGNIEENIADTLEENRKTILENEKLFLKLIEDKISFNNLIYKVFEVNHMKMNLTQFYVIGSVIKAYLSKLNKDGKIDFVLENDDLFIKKNK